MPTLNWLIRESKLNNLRLITGENHILQEISSVNVLDNPDVLKWFKKDELVLTTGFPFKDNSDKQQRQMIRDLKQIGCTALAIKTKRYFSRIPSAIIEEAETLDFPIIELPYFYSFSEISRIVFQQIFSEQYSQTQREQKFLLHFIRQILNHENISFLLQQIARFFALPVLLININYEPVQIAFPFKTFNLNSDELKELSGSISLQLLENNPHISCKINDQLFFIQKISLSNQAGYLGFLHTQENFSSLPISSDFLQNILQLLTFACTQNDSLRTGYDNGSMFFLHFLISNRQNNIEEIKQLCTFYGFDYRKKWICLTLSLQNIADNNKNKFTALLQNSIEKLPTKSSKLFTCHNANLFCIYFLFAPEKHSLQSLHEVQSFALALQKKLSDKNQSVFMGISACHKKIAHIRHAFKESLQALHHQQQKNLFMPGSHLHQLPLHLLGNTRQNVSELLLYNVLQPLLAFDKENHTELIHTLKIYFSCNYNATLAAKTLYLHRNTMLKRLDKIKEILQTDFTNADENALIYLSFSALELQ